MKTKLLITTQALAAIMLFSSCGGTVGGTRNARYIEGGSEEGVVSLDKINSQDFQRAVTKLLQDLYSRGALNKAPTTPAVLFVGNVRNDTQTYFDTDLLLQSLKRDRFFFQGGAGRVSARFCRVNRRCHTFCKACELVRRVRRGGAGRVSTRSSRDDLDVTFSYRR